jgi:hypothetical protein
MADALECRRQAAECIRLSRTGAGPQSEKHHARHGEELGIGLASQRAGSITDQPPISQVARRARHAKIQSALLRLAR